jgi:hypothetical protein
VPSVQRGQVFKLGGGSWAYRYRNEIGRHRQVGGFKTKGEASAGLDAALARARLRPLAAARQDWTLAELVDRYLAQHQAAPATLVRLNAMTKKPFQRSATFRPAIFCRTRSAPGRSASRTGTGTTRWWRYAKS